MFLFLMMHRCFGFQFIWNFVYNLKGSSFQLIWNILAYQFGPSFPCYFFCKCFYLQSVQFGNIFFRFCFYISLHIPQLENMLRLKCTVNLINADGLFNLNGCIFRCMREFAFFLDCLRNVVFLPLFLHNINDMICLTLETWSILQFPCKKLIWSL